MPAMSVPSEISMQKGISMKRMFILLLAAMPFALLSGCYPRPAMLAKKNYSAYYPKTNWNEPSFLHWEKSGASILDVKKALLACGRMDPFGDDGFYNKERLAYEKKFFGNFYNYSILVDRCMEEKMHFKNVWRPFKTCDILHGNYSKDFLSGWKFPGNLFDPGIRGDSVEKRTSRLLCRDNGGIEDCINWRDLDPFPEACMPGAKVPEPSDKRRLESPYCQRARKRYQEGDTGYFPGTCLP
jgi:hypothetical protein